MEKLTKQTKLYLLILFAIWQLLQYYKDFFGLNIPADATKLSVKLSRREDNTTHIIVKMQGNTVVNPHYNDDAMKTIFNEYLNIVLLPEFPELKPFSGGASIYDVVDCLYVNEVSVHANCNGYVDFIYVDNMQAYRAVKRDLNIKKI